MENMFASEGVTKSDRMLHTPGTFAKKNLLYVQEVGKLESLVPHVCRRENLDSYLIFQVTKGSGTITQNSQVIKLHKGDCVWIDCHEAFEHISSEEEPWQLAWIHFNGNCAREYHDLFMEKNGSIVFKLTEESVVQNSVDKIYQLIKENASELEVHAELTHLLVECALQRSDKPKLKDVREFINSNFKEENLIAMIVEKFDTSQEELDKMFEHGYGIGLRDYILNRRFNAAKELLRFTIKPISDVIVESGVQNEDLFYRLFKENESMTPEEYRKNWAQWIKD
ncbi:MAG: AraC family transcriptional regulator [Lachnospiraceae bacterium]